MPHTSSSSIEKLHRHVNDQNHSVRICCRTLIELRKACTEDYVLPPQYRYYLLTAGDSVLGDENVLKRHENKTFEGHSLLVSVFHRSLRDLKGTRVSLKQPVQDVQDFLGGRRHPKLLEHITVFAERCAENFFEEQKYLSSIPIEAAVINY